MQSTILIMGDFVTAMGNFVIQIYLQVQPKLYLSGHDSVCNKHFTLSMNVILE